jgi:hypothetical protein
VSVRPGIVLTAIGLILAATGVGIWSVAVEPDRLIVHAVHVRVRECPSALDGFKIVALSDVHAGAPHVGRDKLRQIAAAVNALDPDVVVFLGDLVIHGVVGGRFMEPEVVGHRDEHRAHAVGRAAGDPRGDARPVKAPSGRGRNFSLTHDSVRTN